MGERLTMLSIGVLSWKAHATLRATLDTLAPLRAAADEAIVYFNEITDEDRAIARAAGFRAEGGPENLGILGGTLAMVRAMRGDRAIALQNDNPLCVPADVMRRRLAQAAALLDSGAAQIVRLRDRFAPGFSDAPKFLRYWPGEDGRDTVARRLRRLLRPQKALRMAGRAPAVLNDPAAVFPRIFTRCGDAFIASSRYVDYTDQPFMASRDLALRLLEWADAHKAGTATLNGLYVPEIAINSGSMWRNADIKIAVTDGIFAHARLDDSFRSDNAAFNPALAGKPGSKTPGIR